MAASGLVDFIDFETDHDPEHLRRVRESHARHEVRLILSYHNFSYTPGLDYLVDRFLEAERLGADVAMVQVVPRDRADVLRLLAATAEADEKTRIPLISMSVGPLGSATRMVGGLFGSWLSSPSASPRRARADPDRRPRDGVRHHPAGPRRRNAVTRDWNESNRRAARARRFQR